MKPASFVFLFLFPIFLSASSFISNNILMEPTVSKHAASVKKINHWEIIWVEKYETLKAIKGGKVVTLDSLSKISDTTTLIFSDGFEYFEKVCYNCEESKPVRITLNVALFSCINGTCTGNLLSQGIIQTPGSHNKTNPYVYANIPPVLRELLGDLPPNTLPKDWGASLPIHFDDFEKDYKKQFNKYEKDIDRLTRILINGEAIKNKDQYLNYIQNNSEELSKFFNRQYQRELLKHADITPNQKLNFLNNKLKLSGNE